MSSYSTCDLPLATFLRCSDVPLVREYNPATKEWSFDDEAKCKKLSLILSNNQAEVNVLQYESCRKQLLAMTKRFHG